VWAEIKQRSCRVRRADRCRPCKEVVRTADPTEAKEPFVAAITRQIPLSRSRRMNQIGHRPCFRPRLSRISAKPSAAGINYPAFMSSIDVLRASRRSARSASSMSR
jgi:hypothetical protein